MLTEKAQWERKPSHSHPMRTMIDVRQRLELSLVSLRILLESGLRNFDGQR